MASSPSSLLSFLSPLIPSLFSSTPEFPTSNPISLTSHSNSNSSLISLSLSYPKNQQNAAITKKEDCPNDNLMAVVCPSLAYSNTLFFNSAYNVQVLVDDNEPEERLLNRFKREVMRAGVIQECKRRRFFENKQDEKKRRTREAAKRNSRRRRPFSRGPYQGKEDAAKVEKKEDDGDNWDMPEDAPF
ncbi:30S ribosomal protein S21, chloroplastic-like isoform X2 [Amaranthus tricolor]|uniref:30S ribosomal protein S21, chloroplastic-like isoform X2 n=1 Tax=Amaranthus tricolor TaxID=29722 RepID=UPI0025849F56|nr:30S ribosomal protein S21, chloroplastic-like isoform X2 [Amaranthus tricolor]